MSINRVIITGNLTRDPELRSTGSGMAVLKMGVAVNDRRKNQQTGEWEDAPNFIDVVMFGTRAESVSPLPVQGLEGRHRRQASLELLGGQGLRSQALQGRSRRRRHRVHEQRAAKVAAVAATTAAPAASAPSADPVIEDDIPF